MNAKWISFEEVARTLRVARPKASEMLRAGRVPGLVDSFGMARVDRQVFEAWVKKAMEPAA